MRPSIPTRSEEAGVSDVLGSVLLVGITVLMAAAFGAVLLAYDGPADVQHTQLAIRVGPGADDDWGTNDAELVIRHIGGEPLDEDDVTVTYTDADGTQTVTPAFTGDKLRLGDEWVEVVSAMAGDGVVVTVVVDQEGGASVLSSGSVSAGGTGSVLTYVNAITPASGKGSVTDLDYARQLSGEPSNAAATLTAGPTGGTPTTVTVAATAASNSGATNGGNVVGSDDNNRATLDNSGEWVQGTTFSGGPTQYAVAALSIGMEARAVQPTVTHVATVTPGTAASTNTVSTLTTIPVTTGEFYVASIANGLSTPRTVTGVAGPSGVTWEFLEAQTNSAGNGRLEVWVGKGTPTLLGVVTATFSGDVDRAAISVSRYSNVDLSGATPKDAVQAFLAGENNVAAGSTTVSLGPIAGTTNGAFFAAVNAITANGATGCNFSSPSNERSDVDGGSNRVQLCTAGGSAATSNTLAATITACSGGCTGSTVQDWQAIIFTIKPLALPTVSLSYSGCTGCTASATLSQALTTTDAQYTVSIIGDKATWALSDLSALAVRVTYTTDTGSDVEVDRVFLSLTYTTTPTTYDTQADLSFVSVPDLDNQVFQMRYKVTGDSFQVYAMTGATERACPGNLASGSFTVFTCTLTAAEYNAGAPVMRIKDPTPGGSTLGTLSIEYARVSSS